MQVHETKQFSTIFGRIYNIYDSPLISCNPTKDGVIHL